MPLALRTASWTGLLPDRVCSAIWPGKGISTKRMIEATRHGERALTLMAFERAVSHAPMRAEVPAGPPRNAKCAPVKYKSYALPNSCFTGSCTNARMCASRRSTCQCCVNDASDENILQTITYHVCLPLLCFLWPSIIPSRRCGLAASSQARGSFGLKPICVRYGTTSAPGHPSLEERSFTEIASNGALRTTIDLRSVATDSWNTLLACSMVIPDKRLSPTLQTSQPNCTLSSSAWLYARILLMMIGSWLRNCRPNGW
mmetsp:Transcript_30376/g.59587  ORF Transcript_30376/g.59587 Transcript_30376/m.59587 type:complete len:258 (-) Transcript_30376:146-919(-)